MSQKDNLTIFKTTPLSDQVVDITAVYSIMLHGPRMKQNDEFLKQMNQQKAGALLNLFKIKPSKPV